MVPDPRYLLFYYLFPDRFYDSESVVVSPDVVSVLLSVVWSVVASVVDPSVLSACVSPLVCCNALE